MWLLPAWAAVLKQIPLGKLREDVQAVSIFATLDGCGRHRGGISFPARVEEAPIAGGPPSLSEANSRSAAGARLGLPANGGSEVIWRDIDGYPYAQFTALQDQLTSFSFEASELLINGQLPEFTNSRGE